MSRGIWAAAAVLLLSALAVPAQEVRGRVVEEVRLRSDPAFEKTAGITLEEMAALSLEEDTRFLRGILLELHLSNLLKQHFDSFALAVYARLTPDPKKGVANYRGKRVFFQPLPYLNRVQLVMPLASTAGEEAEALPTGTFRLEPSLAREDFPILVAILPLMKGIPDTVADSRFFLTTRPLLAKRGLFTLSLAYPPGGGEGDVKVYLNDRELTPAEVQTLRTGQELPSGLYRLRIASSLFKEVNAGFTVESGKRSVADIKLESIATLLSIDAPQNAEVYLDGEKLSDLSALPIEEGAHLVRVKIADFSANKKFTAQRGRHYHLSCIFDIIVDED